MLVETFGGFDVLVSNNGINPVAGPPATEAPPA